MTAIAVHQFAQSITCHAWSPDRSMVAFCPNNNEVHIYKSLQDNWERVHVLQKHDQIVSGIDWSVKSNRIVTASHDRNSYVWNLERSEWVPTLVILRLNRAALCVQWSPKENKFAVGSGAKTVCVCYYEQENNWWVSKLIRKRHDSSVTNVAWHPNNLLLATTSTDGKCRIFATFIKGVDTKDSRAGTYSDSKFGELDLSFSWSFGVKWSPSGNTLAYAGHNSMIYFVDEVGPSPLAQNVAFRDLPLRDILFVSERMVIGVGFDCNPMAFAADERGIWSFIRFLGERKTASGSTYGSQFSEAFGKLYGQPRQGVGNDSVESSRLRGCVHENCIKMPHIHLIIAYPDERLLLRRPGNLSGLAKSAYGLGVAFHLVKCACRNDSFLNCSCIVPLRERGVSTIKRFSTSGLDGKVVIWDLEGQADLSQYL